MAKKGVKLSEEHRKKISDKHKGRHNSPFTEFKKGMKLSEETKNKIRLSHLGKRATEESRKKMSISHKGQKLSKETLEKISGKNCHLWKGGISSLPYSIDWTKTLRQSIRERDKYTCQICGEKQGDIAHSVHHIDYNKLNCSLDNLITLCKSCHIKTNSNREKWKVFFSSR